jgi:predicted small lipoprotein YifL
MISLVAGRLGRALTVVLLVAALGSCGLKGDLYLPEAEKAGVVNQTVNSGNTGTNSTTGTSPNTAVAPDEDEEKTAGKPSEGTSLQP